MWNSQWWARCKTVYLGKWVSQKHELLRKPKEKQYLYKGYMVKGEVRVKQHEKVDHIVIKSSKDIDKS